MYLAYLYLFGESIYVYTIEYRYHYMLEQRDSCVEYPWAGWQSVSKCSVWCAPHCIISLVKVLQQKLILKAIPTFKQVFPCQPRDNNGLKHPLAKKYN